MSHRGEILEVVVNKYSPNKTALAKKMGIDRTTIHRHFKDPDLSDELLLRYAKALKYDFAKEFPELKHYTNMLEEPITEYRPLTLSDALKEIDYWKAKYLNIVEKHNELLTRILEESKR